MTWQRRSGRPHSCQLGTVAVGSAGDSMRRTMHLDGADGLTSERWASTALAARELNVQSTRDDVRATVRKSGWAVLAGAAWFLWLGVADRLLGTLLGVALAQGAHSDSDLLFFSVGYAVGGSVLILAGYAGSRLLELAPLPFPAWKPGVLVVAASSLASLAVSVPTLDRLGASSAPGVFVLRFVLAPAAVLAGIAIAAGRRRARMRPTESREVAS